LIGLIWELTKNPHDIILASKFLLLLFVTGFAGFGLGCIAFAIAWKEERKENLRLVNDQRYSIKQLNKANERIRKLRGRK
jgi:hypothetical protein